MTDSKWFSATDLQQIEAAVQRAEQDTSGEIVPVFVEQAGEYPEAAPKSAWMGMMLTLVGFLIWDLTVPGWGLYDPIWIAALLVAGAISFWLLGQFVAPWRRWIIGRNALMRQAFARSDQWFLNEEVFNTRDRTGIMIFVAKFEHQVIIKADKGIAKLVDHDAWQHIVNDLVASIKAHEPAIGFVEAITSCAKILVEKGVDIRPDDTNELPNSLRME